METDTERVEVSEPIEYETPEAQLGDPPKRRPGRPRKNPEVLDTSGAPVVRRGRKPKKQSYSGEIYSFIEAGFDSVAFIRYPVWRIGFDMQTGELTDESERAAVRTVAENFDKWFQSLDESSPIRLYFGRVLETSPLVFALGGLSRVIMAKVLSERLYIMMLQEKMRAEQDNAARNSYST